MTGLDRNGQRIRSPETSSTTLSTPTGTDLPPLNETPSLSPLPLASAPIDRFGPQPSACHTLPSLTGSPAVPLSFPWPGHGSADKIGWIQSAGPKTSDATAAFEKLDAAARAGRNVLPVDADNYVYLFAGGLFSNVIPAPLYGDQNMAALSAQGLDVRRIPLDTAQGVRHNARTVRDAVLAASKTGKQVVLIGHSKGGLDSAAALALYPELKDKTRALITIQSPYGGSPMADDIIENPVLKQLGTSIVKDIFHGSTRSGLDLRYGARQKFLAAHPLPAGIPVISMASSQLSPLSPLFSTEEYLRQRYGLASDGLVAPVDAMVPGSRTVTLEGLDHGDATLSQFNPFKNYLPSDLTLGLVGLALRSTSGPDGVTRPMKPTTA